MTLEAQIEAVLFYKTEPYTFRELATFLEVGEDVVREACTRLHELRQTSGLALITTDTTVQLVTHPEASALMEKLKKDELAQDIGRAGAETLAIILYRGPLSRADVDRIRGVNSTFIIRNLLVRGLIERRDNPTDSRSFFYAGTPALLQHLGVTRREELPDFSDVMNALDAFEKADREDVLTPTS